MCLLDLSCFMCDFISKEDLITYYSIMNPILSWGQELYISWLDFISFHFVTLFENHATFSILTACSILIRSLDNYWERKLQLYLPIWFLSWSIRYVFVSSIPVSYKNVLGIFLQIYTFDPTKYVTCVCVIPFRWMIVKADT